MELNVKRGSKTLLASVFLSAPGPLILGLGLFMGSSSTQIADFVRRTVELFATIISWRVFLSTADLPVADGKRKRLEKRVDIFVGSAMLISGIAMGFLAVNGFITHSEKGNVTPALVIALLGVISNGILAANYSISFSKTKNDVLRAQKTLYITKTVVDTCVSLALAAVMLFSGEVGHLADFGGGLLVALVLCFNGLRLLALRAIRKL